MQVADLPRLAKESAKNTSALSTGGTGKLSWSLSGSHDKWGHPQLKLAVSATVHPVCQRCLNPFELEINSESLVVLARDEGEADKIEESLGDEDVDVIVGSREMNLLDLIEDEVLLALPLSPKHPVCPDASKQEGLQAEKPSPFAVLKDWKRQS